MKFVTIRDLRSNSARVWRDLAQEREMVITSNGKPIAIVSATDEAHFEQSLQAVRQARAAQATKQLQQQSIDTGRDKLTGAEIEKEVAAARKERRR